MRIQKKNLKVASIFITGLLLLSLGSAQEKRFSFDVEVYQNGTEPKVTSDIIDSRQTTPFMGTGDFNFTLESGKELIDSGTMPVGFEVKGPTEEGGSYIDSVDSKTIEIFFKYDESVETFNIYKENQKIKEVNLTKDICQNSPCDEYCWDAVDNSTLETCENYDGFNETEQRIDEQNESGTFPYEIIFLVLIILLMLAVYLKKNRIVNGNLR